VVAAFAAGVSSVADVLVASPDTKVVETWRTIGFFTFAGLFAVLALRPQQNLQLWMLAIFNKLALTIVGLVYVTQNITGASTVILWDGVLSLFLVTAFFLSRKR